ncbi:MAG: MFS transporter [Candidatus Dormibacteraeota bacterium]|nr:MFS transporter [Candidatus Dormibacteraeota bacterium]
MGRHYKWVALSNTTIGMLMATINSSIVLISLPAIFRGINLNPLEPGNVSYLLWMLMGYMVVTAVLVVSLGRIGDMFGRVRMYNLGFLVFTVGSILLSVVFFTGPAAALALIFFRLIQGVGGAMLFANATAIITDAFPENERGMALGINAVAAISGSFLGLVIGGLLSTTDWHVIFLVSVPVGLFGTVWAFLKLREIGIVRRASIDWAGNITFAVGLIAVLVSITYGIQPYGGNTMGWTNPTVLTELIGGVLLLVAFVVIERHVESPMFRIDLFRNRGFTFGTLAALLSAVGRGGLMFMVIIWLQGIWLPLHGYSFEQTPFWAAIFMLPLTGGFLVGGPVSGYLSDRFGQRLFSTAGMLLAALTFGLLTVLPADFAYTPFALLLFTNGLAMGMFVSPNTAGVMNSVPADRRGVAAGMLSTFQNSGMTLSIGIFFSLMIAGLSNSLPRTLFNGLTQHGVPAHVASGIANLPPVGSLFAAFLGYNPVRTLLGPALTQLPEPTSAAITSNSFFPSLISGPFISGMHLAFYFSTVAMLIAAVASYLRSGRLPRFAAARIERTAALRPPVVAPATAHSPRRPVVTISSSFGALGGEIGPRVAERLGVPFVDRAIPMRVAELLHAPLSEALEQDENVESGVARILAGQVDVLPEFGLQEPPPVQQEPAEATIRDATSAVMHEMADRTGGVFLGRGGMVVLRDRPGVLDVRLDGDEDGRIALAVAHGVPENDVHRLLWQTDRARAAYMRALYGVDLHDPRLYQLVLDTTQIPLEACVDMIVSAVQALVSTNVAQPTAAFVPGASAQRT